MQHVEQVARVGIHRPHAHRIENPRKRALQSIAVFQKIRCPRRTAAIVLEHIILAIGPADQIAAANVNVDVRRHIDTAKLRAIVLGLLDVEAWDDAILEDALVVIDVVEKQVERHDPLGEAGLKVLPLARRHDPRDRIERENPLGTAVVVVNIEGDPLTQEIQLGAGLAREEIPRIDVAEAVLQRAAMRPHVTIGGEHFIVKNSGIVALEQIHGLPLPTELARGGPSLPNCKKDPTAPAPIPLARRPPLG